jgi:hypothetical protein
MYSSIMGHIVAADVPLALIGDLEVAGEPSSLIQMAFYFSIIHR